MRAAVRGAGSAPVPSSSAASLPDPAWTRVISTGSAASPPDPAWTPVSIGTDDAAVAERDAIGTSVRVAVWPACGLTAALAAVDAEVGRLDREASRFRADSEISRIHQAGGGACRVTPGLAEAIHVALAAARWTGGLVDPTVGGALIALGYDRDFAVIGPGSRQPRALSRPGPVPGWRSVTLNGTWLRLPAGVRLDLGATAKGLGSDRAASAAWRERARGRARGRARRCAGQPGRRHRHGRAGTRRRVAGGRR